MIDKSKKSKRKRPVAVTVVGLIAMAVVILYLVLAALILLGLGVFQTGHIPSGPWWEGLKPTQLGKLLFEVVYLLILGLVTFLIAINFILMRRWAWVALMTWTGITLALNLMRYLYGSPDYFSMFLAVVLVLAMNQADVQQVFGIQHREEEVEGLG
jgi:lysylphosphatidylglycerol synthetase-like protein (DUF2156 family)